MTGDLYDGLTPAQVLERYPALTMTQAAFVLQLCHVRGAKKGSPDRRRFIDLLTNTKSLWVINPSMPSAKWLISTELIKEFLGGKK